MKYNKEDLAKRAPKLKKDTYIAFYEKQTNNFLSSSYVQEVEYKGHKVYSAEHLITIMKAEFFEDFEALAKLIRIGGPDVEANRYRRISRSLKDPYNRSEQWEKNKHKVMKGILSAKFLDPSLRKQLLNTGDKIIIEAGKSNREWGSGLNMGEATFDKPKRWAGDNLTGFILMEIRDEIKK